MDTDSLLALGTATDHHFNNLHLKIIKQIIIIINQNTRLHFLSLTVLNNKIWKNKTQPLGIYHDMNYVSVSEILDNHYELIEQKGQFQDLDS